MNQNRNGKKKNHATREMDRISISVHCPKCRRRMVLREGPQESFYGCTGFPNDCRHTLTIAQAIGLHRHIEEKRCARKGKAAKKSAKKRIDLRAAVREAETAIHRSKKRHQEVPSKRGSFQDDHGKGN